MTDLTPAQRRELQTRCDALMLVFDHLNSCNYDMQASESREQQLKNLGWLEHDLRDLTVVVLGLRAAFTTPGDQ